MGTLQGPVGHGKLWARQLRLQAHMSQLARLGTSPSSPSFLPSSRPSASGGLTVLEPAKANIAAAFLHCQSHLAGLVFSVLRTHEETLSP